MLTAPSGRPWLEPGGPDGRDLRQPGSRSGLGPALRRGRRRCGLVCGLRLIRRTAAALFAGLPTALVAAVAGLAMVPSLRSALTGAMAEPSARLRALFTLLLTAADVSLLGIGAPRRALVVGLLTTQIAARTET